MKTIKFAQSQIAVITAVCIALGHPFPAGLPLWDGRNLRTFKATKEAFNTNPKDAKHVAYTKGAPNVR